MTDAQRTVREINRMLAEYSDGFFFCGFNPKDGEPILAVEAKDAKTIMALNNTLFGVLQSGGVEAMQNQIKKKNEGVPES